MNSLPYDVIADIFCHVKDPYSLSLVNHQLYQITQDPVCIARRLLVLYGNCFESQVLEPVMMPSPKVTQILLDNGCSLPRHFVQKLESGYYQGMLNCSKQSLDIIERQAVARFGPRFDSAEDESQLVSALLERIEQTQDRYELDQLHQELNEIVSSTDYVPVTLGIKDNDLLLILRLIVLAPEAFDIIRKNGFTLRNISRTRDFVTLFTKVGCSTYTQKYTVDQVAHALQVLYDTCNLDIQPHTVAEVFEKIISPEYLSTNASNDQECVHTLVMSKLDLPFDINAIAGNIICRCLRDSGCLTLYKMFPCPKEFTEAFLKEFPTRDCPTAPCLTSHYAIKLLDIFKYPHPVTQRSFDIIVHRLVLATFGNEYPLKQKRYQGFRQQVPNSSAPIDRENRAFHYYLDNSSARLTKDALCFDGREYEGTVEEENKRALNILFDAILKYGVSQWSGADLTDLKDGKAVLGALLEEERIDYATRNRRPSAEDAAANKCILSTFHSTLEQFYQIRVLEEM